MTTVDAQIASVACRMAEMLIDAIRVGDQPELQDPFPEVFEAVYVIRETVGRPRTTVGDVFSVVAKESTISKLEYSVGPEFTDYPS